METAFSFSAELTAPDELRGRTPRRALLSGNGIQIVIASAILLALAAAGVLWSGRRAATQSQMDSALSRNGLQTEATITHFQTIGPFNPRVNYTFTANGKTYAGAARAPGSLKHALAGFSSLPVVYLPANPAMNRPAAWQRSSLLQVITRAVPLFAAVLGFLLFVPLVMERRMAAYGAPVLAVITRCAPARTGYVIKYEFRTENGAPIRGRGWYKSRQELGTSIWVLCRPKSPGRNLLYPLSYWRVIG